MIFVMIISIGMIIGLALSHFTYARRLKKRIVALEELQAGFILESVVNRNEKVMATFQAFYGKMSSDDAWKCTKQLYNLK